MAFSLGLELGSVVEELAHTAHQVEPCGHRLQQNAAIVLAEESAGRSLPVDEGGGGWSHQGQGLLQIGHDRDAVGHAVQHLSGIQPGTVAVDHGSDLKGLAVTHQDVGCLAVETGEMAGVRSETWRGLSKGARPWGGGTEVAARWRASPHLET
jgi:hypothetical protein